MKVKDIMKDNIVSISIDETLRLAEDIMTLGEIRHLPVVKGGRLVGVVSQRDLLRASLTSVLEYSKDERESFMESVDIKDAMSRDVVTVGKETPVHEAVKKMLENKIGCLPVVTEEMELIGMVTETDILRCFVEYLDEGA